MHSGEAFKIDSRSIKVAELDKGLAGVSRELAKVLQGEAASKLRARVTLRRDKFYDKTGFEDMFRGLSERAFIKGHPMHGSLLVGPTEPADDMFLEPEPTWALDTTVSLRGPIDATEHAAALEKAFAGTFESAKPPGLAPAARVSVGEGSRHLLVGWVAPPLTAKNEAASYLAFMIACHNKVGRLHRALRHDRALAARVNCSLELAPQATVGWVIASPAMPNTVGDAEKAVDEAIAKLFKDGPTDQEVAVARERLRVELARERELATIRGLPKSRVAAVNDRILARAKTATKSDVAAAARALFQKEHRIAVAGD